MICCDGDIDKSKAKNIPVIVRLDGMYSPACGSDYKEKNRPLIEAGMKANHIIFLNEFCKETYEYFSGLTVNNYSYAYNGCEIGIFKPGKKEFKDNILVYGELRRPCQVDVILRAIPLVRKEIPNAKLWFVGGGKPEVIELIPEVDYIELGEPIPNHTLPKYANQCSVMAMTSPKAADHSAVSECLACGLPVVCYDNGGVHSKVKDGGIILKSEYYDWQRFPDENEEVLAIALIRILKNKQIYYEKAISRRKDLSLSVMKRKYLEVINEFAKTRD